MKRLMVILGIALMVLAFAILTLFVIAPAIVTLDNAPLLKSIMQTAFCKPNEVLTADYSTFSIPGETRTSIDYNCVDEEKNPRDVSGNIIGIGVIGYLVPFLIGLFMTMYGAQVRMRTRVTYTALGNDLAAQNAKAERLEALLESRQKSSLEGFTPSEHISLTQHLQELKEAFNAGLITEAEYTAKRKELLNQS